MSASQCNGIHCVCKVVFVTIRDYNNLKDKGSYIESRDECLTWLPILPFLEGGDGLTVSARP